MTQTQNIVKDTPTREAEHTDPNDPQQTGSGTASAPGGAAAPPRTSQQMSHDEESYPGPRNAGEANPGPAQSDPTQSQAHPGDVPEAGDTDPDSTRSADETGQAGDTSNPTKNKANDYNG